MEWENKAERNIEKWGDQPPADIVLALAEELGEVAEELDNQVDDRFDVTASLDDAEYRGYILFRRVMTLGLEIQRFIDETYEDDEGKPIPPDDRPRILDPIKGDVEGVMDEIDDLGPLVYQLRKSVKGHGKRTREDGS